MALIGAWNGKSVSMGAHYVAVEKNGVDSFRVYNYNNDVLSYKTFSKIDKSVTGGDIIIAYIVG